MERDEPPAGDESGTQVPAGSLSALLKQLAADPVGSFEQDWQLGLVAGQAVGRFQLLRELGRGGFGVVFEAKDTGLGRKVALKALRTGGRAGLKQERLQAEAEAAARLSHPNIVTLHDFGRTDQGPYLVLELLEGEPLSERAAAGALPVPEALRIGTEVARALAHAHEHGVVHRDLKPGNVFLCGDGRVKVLDFGLAHAFGHRRVAGGTPAYMAPEQWREAPEDERTDVFALGVILFRLLSGRLPFPADDDGRAVTGSGQAPALEVPGLPALGELVGRMLEKDPVKRPRDGAEALRALDAVAAELEGTPGAGRGPVRTRRRPRLRLAALLALGVLVGGGAVGVAVWMRGRAGPARGGRVVVAVADIANETKDPELDPLAGMLVTSLEQSSQVSVIPRVRLVDLLRPADADGGAVLDERRAREAARLGRADALLLMRLYRLGERYVATTALVEPATDRSILALREEARTKEDLPDLLDRVSVRVRAALGEAPGAIRETSIQLARTVTSNLEAWGHYSRGLACLEGQVFAASYDACLEELRRAVAADPDFALAHLLMAQIGFMQGLPLREQRAALEPAVRLVGRIPPHDRLRVEGLRALLDGKGIEAKGLLRRAAEAAREDKLAWWTAGETVFHRDEFAESIPMFRRVRELDPRWLEPTQHLIVALGSSGDLEGLRDLARELEGSPRDPTALAALCLARLWVEPARAVDACEKSLAAGSGHVGEELLALALLHRGDRRRLWEQVDRIAKGAPLNTFGPFMRLLLLTQEGRWREVQETFAQAAAVPDAWFHASYTEAIAGLGDPALLRAAADRTLALDRGVVSHVAPHLAYQGDLSGAAAFEPHLQEGSPRAAVYRALVRWRRGDLEGAIGDLREVTTRARISSDPGLPHPLYLLGHALAEAGRDAEAIQALEGFRRIPLTYPSWQLQRALFHLARCRHRSGDSAGARRDMRDLLALWERAGSEQPLLREARALGRELGLR